MLAAVNPELVRKYAEDRRAMVANLYREILKREPDPGAENWARSTMTEPELRDALLFSPEGQAVAHRAKAQLLLLGAVGLGAFLLLRRR